jgi:hypothetical protein
MGEMFRRSSAAVATGREGRQDQAGKSSTGDGAGDCLRRYGSRKARIWMDQRHQPIR